MEKENKTIIEIRDGEAVEFVYNPFSNSAIIQFSNYELRLPMKEMIWLCQTFLEKNTHKRDIFKEKYESLVEDYVYITKSIANFMNKNN